MGAIGLLSAAIFCVLISQGFANTKYHVPVLIWGSNYEPSGSDGISYLSKVSSEDFTNQFLKNVHKLHKKPTVVVFIEETLSVEDFSLQKGSFPALKDIVSKNKKEFIQSVENPVPALSGSEIKSFGMSVVNFEKGVDAKKGGVVYLVNLEDADSKEDRPQLLQRHDKKIAEIYNDLLKTNSDVIGVLTGNSASWTGSEEVVRVRRQANETNETDTAGKQPQPEKAFTGFHLETQTALIYTKEAPVLKIDDKEVVLPNPTSKIHDDRDKWQRAIFSYVTDMGKVNLRFRFENTSSYYWSLSQIELEGPEGLVKESPTLLTTKQYIGAPYGSSFHVSQPVVFRNKTISLTFTDMQVQPWKSPSGLQKKFSVAEDDTTFFTPAIWNGLIVTGLIGIILIWALTMITDIRTMDQFDDPKGKTITVNVTD